MQIEVLGIIRSRAAAARELELEADEDSVHGVGDSCRESCGSGGTKGGCGAESVRPVVADLRRVLDSRGTPVGRGRGSSRTRVQRTESTLRTNRLLGGKPKHHPLPSGIFTDNNPMSVELGRRHYRDAKTKLLAPVIQPAR